MPKDGSPPLLPYEAQLASAPRHRIVLAVGARHFVMMDDAPFLLAQLDAFLAEAR